MPSHASFYLSDSAPFTAELLRRHAPDAVVRERRSGFLRRVEAIEVAWRDARMSFTRMDARELPEHLAGFAGFVQAKAGREAPALLRRVRGIQQVVGATIEPGVDAGGQVERLVFALAAERHALVVREAGVFDERGRLVVDPSAAPVASEPPVGREPRLLVEPLEQEAEATVEPPAPERVLRRALALAATSLRGQLEYETADRGAKLKRLREAVLRHGIGGELEPAEQEILVAAPGEPSSRAALDASWRAEGVVVLSWALGLVELPGHDRMAGADDLVLMGWLFSAQLPAAAATPTLRPPAELEAMRKHLLGVHWRLRDHSLQVRTMDFAAFSRKCWFGQFELMDLRLVEGDLAVGGAPIARAAPEDVARASSIAHERHRAINWLVGDAARYEDVDTST